LITLDDLDGRDVAIWHALFDLAHRRPNGWTLVGAQMVALHAAEHRRSQPRRSRDADILADVRVVQDATRQVSKDLLALGFEWAGMGPDHIGHRFQRGSVQIDVLAPDGVGRRARLTTLPPARTVSVPGGTQALRRTERVMVSVGGKQAWLPRPNLLGAILLKCRAVDVDDTPENQRLDFVFLLSLVADARAIGSDLQRRERTWLRRRRELLDDRRHSAWHSLGSIELAEMAHLTLRVLADGPRAR